MLALDRLRVTIDRRDVVRDVSLTLQAHESVALVGPSGSGKSLTAAALGGYLPPRARAAGVLALDGRPVTPAGRRHAGIASVRQDSLTALHPLVRIDRQLLPALHGAVRGLSAAARTGRIRELLSEVGFPDPTEILRRYPMELSGGQRQRVCLVQALATVPRFVIADEPTTALDPVSRSFVLSALGRAAAGGTGVLLITHDLAAAASLCSRAVVLTDGAVVDGGEFVRPEPAAARELHAEPVRVA